ncbi:hypothetical protein HPB51_028522 [Rhipicephalus microplus]|uniref:Uncharacterized protein n=1 Tax=Rhipicephalus microplus TaxID=6941 RepID=A0A9J6CXB1_RHIMP|nr:hypothetical protein HPB51_028522 [Rhipicephalus microplus]
MSILSSRPLHCDKSDISGDFIITSRILVPCVSYDGVIAWLFAPLMLTPLRIETVANNRQYFQLILHLVATKEEVLELVIGWLCVQYTSWFANRELIANFYGYPENADLRHRRVCLAFTISLTGIALLVPFVQGVYTEPVRKDAWGITRAVRRTVYQTLDEATYPWHEITSVFRFLDIAVVHDLEARSVETHCAPN